MSDFKRRRLLWFAPIACLFFVATFSVAAAGQQTQASIIGQVTDESRGVIPGVTVTATSPSLQVPSVTDVTNEQGEYRLTPLPIGTYTVVYTLQGFQTLRREGLQLTAGFVAREDVVLKVGALEETLTVSGAAPVVDVTTTSTATHFTRETLDLLPSSRNSLIGLLAQAPGVRTNLDVGGGTVGGRPWNRLFGQPGEPWYRIEGVVTSSLTLDGGAANYWDYNTIDEARMETLGADAEAPTRGVQLNAIVKSGGNEFHGGGSVNYTTGRLQSDNIDEDLEAQGITSGNPLKGRDDYFGELGGRVVRDKVWFYTAGHRRSNKAQRLGAFEPDGTPANQRQVETYLTQKVSYQLSQANKFVGFFQRNTKHTVTPGPSYVAWERRGTFWGNTRQAKVDWQGVRGNTVFSVLQGYWNQYSHNPRITDLVGRQDLVTLEQSGGGRTGERSENRRWQTTANVTSYQPNVFYGNHELKAGIDYTANSYARLHSVDNRGAGAKPGRLHNYELRFQNGVPFQINVFNGPNYPWASSNYIGAYAKDTWTIRRRLTLNLGIRYAWDHGFVEGKCVEAADPPGHVVFPAVCRETAEMPIYSTLVPRMHASYDLTGDGRTVIKAGWARFARMIHLDPDVVKLDPNRPNNAFYRWRDLNGNLDYDPGEVNLDPNGPDYVSRGDDLNAVPNPNEKPPMSDELSVGLERLLGANVALRVTGVYARGESLRLQNNLRPYESYSIPVRNPDPGDDGIVGTADDPGTTVTYYEFPRALAGLANEEFMTVNAPEATRTYKSFEVSAYRRLQNRWQFAASYSATKKNIPVLNALVAGGFLPEVSSGPLNPNGEINTADRTWEWLGKVSGAYIFPAEVMVSANYEHRSGDAFARQVQFRGGQTIPSIVLNVEPIGTRRLPNINLVNLRVTKTVTLGGDEVLLRLNLYNVLNANTVDALTMRAGASFLRPTAILQPRIVEFGVSYRF